MKDQSNDQSIIHLRVERDRKGRWIALSRKEGMTLTDWIVRAVESKIGESNSGASASEAPSSERQPK